MTLSSGGVAFCTRSNLKPWYVCSAPKRKQISDGLTWAPTRRFWAEECLQHANAYPRNMKFGDIDLQSRWAELDRLDVSNRLNTHTYTYIYVHKYMYIYIYIYAHEFPHIHTYMFIYVYIHINTSEGSCPPSHITIHHTKGLRALHRELFAYRLLL